MLSSSPRSSSEPFGKQDCGVDVLRCSVLQPPGHPWTSLEGNRTGRQRAALPPYLCLCLRFLLQPLLSPLHHRPELSQPCGQNQSLSLAGVRLVWSPLRPFLKCSQCQGAELCPTQVVGPTGMYSPVLHPTVRAGLPQWPQHHHLLTAPTHQLHIMTKSMLCSEIRERLLQQLPLEPRHQHGGERVAGVKKSFPISTDEEPHTKQAEGVSSHISSGYPLTHVHLPQGTATCSQANSPAHATALGTGGRPGGRNLASTELNWAEDKWCRKLCQEMILGLQNLMVSQ